MFAQPVSFRLPLNTLVDQTLVNGFAALINADFNGDGKPDIAYLDNAQQHIQRDFVCVTRERRWDISGPLFSSGIR